MPPLIDARGRLPHGRLVHACRQHGAHEWRTLCALPGAFVRTTEEAIDCPDCLAHLTGRKPRSAP